MTEPEWMACERPDELLWRLRGRLEERDLRRVAAAFCRRTWEHLGEPSREAVLAAERHAAGDQAETALLDASRIAARALRDALGSLDIHVARNGHLYHAAYAAAAACWLPGVPIERDPRRGEPESLLDAAVRAAVHASYAVAIARTPRHPSLQAYHADLARATIDESRAQAEIVRNLFPDRPGPR